MSAYTPPPRDPRLQAAYDNMARVPEAPEIIAGWARDAAAFRAATAWRAIAYGGRQRERIELFGPEAAPIALFLHGGYWQKLDPSYFSHLAAGLMVHGAAVAVVGYDLCPEVTLRHITAQVAAACRALPRRPGLAIGHSAGGHLAAMLLAEGLVPAALPISGLFDLRPLRRTSIGDALRLTQAEAQALSPLFRPPPRGRRLHAVVGALESAALRTQSATIARAWGGVAEELPGENHFTIIASLARADGLLTRRALGLLRG